MGLSGKVALITRGGTGIGKAIAEALAKDRARVAIVSRNPSHFETAKAALQGLCHEPEEVAQLVLYLASDKTGGITGQAINICGGQTTV